MWIENRKNLNKVKETSHFILLSLEYSQYQHCDTHFKIKNDALLIDITQPIETLTLHVFFIFYFSFRFAMDNTIFTNDVIWILVSYLEFEFVYDFSFFFFRFLFPLLFLSLPSHFSRSTKTGFCSTTTSWLPNPAISSWWWRVLIKEGLKYLAN